MPYPGDCSFDKYMVGPLMSSACSLKSIHQYARWVFYIAYFFIFPSELYMLMTSVIVQNIFELMDNFLAGLHKHHKDEEGENIPHIIP
jgi:hypothetical protein